MYRIPLDRILSILLAAQFSIGICSEARGEQSVTIRRYADWENRPAEYTGSQANFDGTTLLLGSSPITDDSILVLHGDDQTEKVGTIGKGQVFVWRAPVDIEGEKKNELQFHAPRSGRQQLSSCYIIGAIIPSDMPGASVAVEVWERAPRGMTRLFQLEPGVTNSQAEVSLPYVALNLQSDEMWPEFRYIVSHENYGSAYVEWAPSNWIRLPLVAKDSPAATRAALGRIVDPDGNPIRGARISCSYVTTPGQGSNPYSHSAGSVSVLTGENGEFRYYQPADNSNESHWDGGLIPPGSRYQLRIAPPKGLHLFPTLQEFTAGEFATCTLKPGGSDHTLSFRDAEGKPLPSEATAQVRIGIQRFREPYMETNREELLQGGFPDGKYTASAQDFRGGNYIAFEPVEVGPASPKEIVFQLMGGKTIEGRVVNGLTGEPIAGAFVTNAIGAMTSYQDNAALVTDAAWDALHRLPIQPTGNEPALERFHTGFGTAVVTRTGPDGRFTFRSRSGAALPGIAIFDQNWIPVYLYLQILSKNPDGQTLTDDVPLYPAARVKVVSKQNGMWPDWTFGKEDGPCWAQSVKDYDRKAALQFQYAYYLDYMPEYFVFVPAGCRLHLKFDNPYSEYHEPILIPEAIELKQGEILDLGELKPKPTVPIEIVARDETGKPLEGIPLHVRMEGNCWSIAHTTSAAGSASFRIPAGKETLAGIPREDRFQIPVTATGEESSPPIFNLTIPSESVQKILEAK